MSILILNNPVSALIVFIYLSLTVKNMGWWFTLRGETIGSFEDRFAVGNLLMP